MTGSPAYTVTNFNTVVDSPTYKSQLDANSAVLQTLGAWFAPQASSPAAMTVTVNAGALFVSGVIVAQAAQTTGTITAPTGSNKRIDRVVINAATGAISVITGTPTTGTPTAPAITAGNLPCCQIGPLLSSTTSIGTSLVIDERAVVQQGYQQTLLTSGSGNFAIPAATFWAEIWGGGGGGGGGGTSNFGGGGGGAGAYVAKLFTGQTIGGTIAYAVGSGGGGGTAGGAGSGGAGSNGGNTTFGALTANGGTGGSASTGGSIATGGAGGTASGGDLNFAGIAGGTSTQSNAAGGAGGSGGGSPLGGMGGQSGQTAATCAGSGPGAGGAGAYGLTNIVGGAGQGGLIRIRW